MYIASKKKKGRADINKFFTKLALIKLEEDSKKIINKNPKE